MAFRRQGRGVCLRSYFPESIVKVVLHRKLAAIIVLLTLFGANTALASICEAYCGDAGNKNADYHHQTVPSSHHHTHVQQHYGDCPKCPKGAGRRSMQPPNCGNLAQAQILQDNPRILSRDREVSQLDVAKSSTGSPSMPIESEHFSSFHSPPNLRGFGLVLTSLRI
jgi:hypothetical protein